MDARTVIDWGIATRTLPGQTESGDLHFVRGLPTGVLVSVIDGLGHGAEAAAAARAAGAVLERHAHEALPTLIERCHQALVGTRGVVMSIAFFDHRAETMTWLGVGNVDGILLRRDRDRRTRASLVTRGGIVGREMPPVRAAGVPLSPGDTLLLASDGIKSGFTEDAAVDASPQQMADQILARYAKGTDDALVLVARYRGGAGALR